MCKILQICKRYFIKRIYSDKHTAAMDQHNSFSVYSNNCNELAEKYGANFDSCTNRILNVSNVNVLQEMIDILCQEKMIYILLIMYA